MKSYLLYLALSLFGLAVACTWIVRAEDVPAEAGVNEGAQSVELKVRLNTDESALLDYLREKYAVEVSNEENGTAIVIVSDKQEAQ